MEFPGIAEFLDPILTSIATHDMSVTPEGDHYRITTPFGLGWLRPMPGQLQLLIETGNPHALNRLKHALVGPILFIAASEKLDIHWKGDAAAPVPLDDLRILRVVEVVQVTPHMRRILFRGDDLERFDRPDQLHCRLIFQPKAVQVPEWPMIDHHGHIVWPGGHKLDTRVYTIRRIDAARGEIAIDFALYDEPGPATAWALAVEPGDLLGIVGPAADGPKRAEFYVLAGDETGLPGIARILEWMGQGAKGIAFIEVDGSDEVQPLHHPPGLELRWLYRNGAPGGHDLTAR